MSDAYSSIRNSAKAIIVRDGCVLLVRINDGDGEWYVLPGGGQRFGESLRETVRRECLEEIGVAVEAGELRLVREYIGRNHDNDEQGHRVEFMFECRLDAAAIPNGGVRPDSQQTGVVWASLADLAAYCLYPTGLRPDSSRRNLQGWMRVHGGRGVVRLTKPTAGTKESHSQHARFQLVARKHTCYDAGNQKPLNSQNER